MALNCNMCLGYLQGVGLYAPFGINQGSDRYGYCLLHQHPGTRTLPVLHGRSGESSRRGGEYASEGRSVWSRPPR